jgi:urea transport system substrate-binding protein
MVEQSESQVKSDRAQPFILNFQQDNKMATITSSKLIMIIEDDTEILSSVKIFLELEDYRVLTAENGFEAMNILKTSGMPNLILLDMKMPIMNGWEFAKEFLDKYDSGAPIIVMTAAPDAEQRAKDIHAMGWLAKPFDLDVLLAKVKKNER